MPRKKQSADMFNDTDGRAKKRSAESWQAITEYIADGNVRYYPGTTKEQWMKFFAGKGKRPIPFGTPMSLLHNQSKE